MGTKTDEYLASLMSDSFKREVDAEEAVWRSLPFFGAMIALAVALFPPVYQAAARVAELGWRIPVYLLLVGSLFCFAIAGWWFWALIRPRRYRYPANDEAILLYAAKLRDSHREKGASAEQQDEQVRNALRTFIIDEFAESTTNNRANNNIKLRSRSQVLLLAMAGFLLAFLCEAIILASQVFSPVRVDSDGGQHGRGTSPRR